MMLGFEVWKFGKCWVFLVEMSHSGKLTWNLIMSLSKSKYIYKFHQISGVCMLSKLRGVDCENFPERRPVVYCYMTYAKIGNLGEKWCPCWILWGCKIAQSIAVSFLTLFRLSSFIITEWGWQHKSLSNKKNFWRNEEMLIRKINSSTGIFAFENGNTWNGLKWYILTPQMHPSHQAGSTGFKILKFDPLRIRTKRCVKSKQNSAGPDGTDPWWSFLMFWGLVPVASQKKNGKRCVYPAHRPIGMKYICIYIYYLMVVTQIFFGIFTPKPWGFMIQFDDHIFQYGWNHHLVYTCCITCFAAVCLFLFCILVLSTDLYFCLRLLRRAIKRVSGFFSRWGRYSLIRTVWRDYWIKNEL